MLKPRNYSIDLFKIVCAVFVVVIHTVPFADISQTANMISLIISRIAVPFFFTVSGYFYSRNLLNEQGKRKCKHYIMRIVILYAILTIIYQAAVVFKGGIASPAQYIKELIVEVFATGTYYHLWYFPILIYSLLFLTFFVLIHKTRILNGIAVVLGVVGVLMCAYPFLFGDHSLLTKLMAFDQLDVIRRLFSTGIPFTLMGYLIQKYHRSWNKRAVYIGILCFTMGHFAESVLSAHFFYTGAPILTFSLFGLTPLLFIACVIHPIPLKTNMDLSGYSSMIYYIHPLIILISTSFLGNIKSYYLFFIAILGSTLFFLLFSAVRKLYRYGISHFSTLKGDVR